LLSKKDKKPPNSPRYRVVPDFMPRDLRRPAKLIDNRSHSQDYKNGSLHHSYLVFLATMSDILGEKESLEATHDVERVITRPSVKVRIVRVLNAVGGQFIVTSTYLKYSHNRPSRDGRDRSCPRRSTRVSTQCRAVLPMGIVRCIFPIYHITFSSRFFFSGFSSFSQQCHWACSANSPLPLPSPT